jgi:hypothetical protein
MEVIFKEGLKAMARSTLWARLGDWLCFRKLHATDVPGIGAAIFDQGKLSVERMTPIEVQDLATCRQLLDGISVDGMDCSVIITPQWHSARKGEEKPIKRHSLHILVDVVFANIVVTRQLKFPKES